MTRRRLRAFMAGTEGASAIEFAVVSGPLLLIVFGCIEFGRLLWIRTALQETATVAARCMGIRHASCAPSGTYSSAQTTSYVQGVATGWSIAIPTSGITLNNNTSCQGIGGFSQVQLSYTFQTAVPLFVSSLSSVPLQIAVCFPNQS